METKNWQQVEIFFHSALVLNGAERAAYLTEACGGDDSLRGEVESLIAAFEEREDFLDEPAFDLGMDVMRADLETSLTGRTIGSYQILNKLGSGGMGEVYLAEDTRLGRQVALKFLSQSLSDDKWAKRQLVREAQAIAMLDHPNICPVYGIEEIGQHNFIVMQYVKGVTLAHSIRRQRLPAEQIYPLAQQIISAVAIAHDYGIIHRDIKTGNIMVTPNGQVKVLDFGLAKIIKPLKKTALAGEDASQFSQQGLVVGTVAYMSPEQLKADKLDYRTDIFSIGTVLFELVSGAHPFLQKSDAETISSILTVQPDLKPHLDSKAVPPGIELVIKKCLEKDKEKRYQSASELLGELQILEAKNFQTGKNSLRSRLLVSFLTLILLLAVGGLLYQRAARPRTLAVLPFVNESADPAVDYMSDGIAETLIDKLSRSSKLRVKPLTLVSGYRDDVEPVKIARSLDVDAILTGKILRRNGQLRLQTKLINTSDGTELWGEEDLLNESETLAIQNNIAEKVVSKLQPLISGGPSEIRTAPQPADPQAFKHYLQGRFYWKKRDKEGIQRAIDAFNRAKDIDPNYAQAYAGLADAYIVRSTVTYNPMPAREASVIAKYNAEQAIRIDDELGESHAALGVVQHRYEWNWAAAEKQYRRALELNPDYAQTYYWYSNLLAITGKTEEAFVHSLKAQELDPFSPLADVNVGRVLYYARQYDKSHEQLTSALKKDPGNSSAEYVIGLIHLQKGKYSEALKIFEKLYGSDKKQLAAAVLGFTYGKLGRKAEARKILDDLNEFAGSNGYLPPQEIAIVYLGLGDKENALYWFEKSYQEHSPSLVAINVEPLFDDLRSDPRFEDIISRMNLNLPDN
jgi:serine/threonine-protein kinase